MFSWAKSLLAMHSGDEVMAEVTKVCRSRSDKADVEALMKDLLLFAEKMLREHKEFLPFGGHMKPDGTIVWQSAPEGREHPPSQDLIDLLLTTHQKQAGAREIKACATLYDARLIPPNRTEKRDAIAVALDHRSGYSVVVIFPYYFNAGGQLCIEQPFANKGQDMVFGGSDRRFTLKPYFTPAALLFIAILALYHLGGAWFEEDWRVGFLFLILPVFISATWYVAQTYRRAVRAYRQASQAQREIILDHLGEDGPWLVWRAHGKLRQDWRWMARQIVILTAFVAGPLVAYYALSDEKPSMHRPMSDTAGGIMFGSIVIGLVIFFWRRRWYIRTYRCRRCGSQLAPAPGMHLVFPCPRCGIVWSTGERKGETRC